MRSVVTGAIRSAPSKANGTAIVETNGDHHPGDRRSARRCRLRTTLDGYVQITDGRAEIVELNAAVDARSTSATSRSTANLHIASPVRIDAGRVLRRSTRRR